MTNEVNQPHLALNGDFLEVLLDGLSLPLLLTDSAQVIRFANQACLAVFGLPNSGLVGTELQQHIRAGELASLWTHLEAGDASAATSAHLHQGDGHWVAAHLTARRQVDPAGNSLTLLELQLPSQKPETEPAPAMAALRALLTSPDDQLFELDEAAKILTSWSVNPQPPATSGMAFPEQSFFTHLEPDLAGKIRALFEQTLSDGQTGELEYSVLTASDPRWFLLRAVRLQNQQNNQPGQLAVLVREISSQKKEAEHNHLLASLLDMVAHAIIVTGPDGSIKLWNKYAEAMLGWKAEEVLGKNMTAATAEQMTAEQFAQMSAQLSTGQPWTGEITVLDRGGNTFPVLAITSLYLDRQGQYAGFIGITLDIRERKQAQQAQQIAEQRYMRLVEKMPVTMYSYSLNENNHGYISPQAEQLLGYPLADLASNTNQWEQWIYPADLEHANQIYHSIFSMDQASDEYRMVRRDGQVIWVRNTAVLIRDENGQPAYIQGFISDINEYKQAADALQASEANYRSLVENSETAIAVLDRDGRFLYANPSAISVWQSEAGVVGKTIFDVYPPEYAKQYLKSIRWVIDRQLSILDELQSPINGNLLWFRLNMQPILNPDGSSDRMLINALDITGPKNAQEQIRQSNERFTELANHSQDAFWIVEPASNKYLYVSPAFERLVGLSEQAVRQLPGGFMALVHPQDRPILKQARQQQARGQISDIQYRILRPDGSTAWVRNLETPVVDENGRVVRVVGTMSDITLRIDAMRKVQDSEERFQQLANNLEVSFWIADAQNEHKILYANPAYETIWGLKLADYYRDPLNFIKRVLPEDRPGLVAAIEKVNSGHRSELEFRIQAAHGGIRWIWERRFPIFDATGKIIRTAGISTDITELKVTQLKLEESNRNLELFVEKRTHQLNQSEATYRALFENSQDGIFLFSPSGEVIEINPPGRSLLGKSALDLTDFSEPTHSPSDEHDPFSDMGHLFHAVLHGKQVPLSEKQIRLIDGSSAFIEIDMIPLRAENGQISMVQAVVRDISERKKAEEVLRDSRNKLSEANDFLEKAARMKDEFLASMSHELRTPLTGILGLSDALLLNMMGPLDQDQTRAIENIQTSGLHLLELINDILDLSKIEAGSLNLEIDSCQASEICQASLLLVKGMYQKKKQDVSYSMQPTSIRLQADQRRLKQMLVNLLSNAIKFTPEKGRLGLEVRLNQPEGNVEFCVWDEGIGINAADFDKLFKPFLQLDSRLQRQYSGTGLGLSLVQRMADLHGGSIRVESTPGKGSRFTIVLPLQAQAAPRSTSSTAGEPTGLKQALVIETNPLASQVITQTLHELGIGTHIHPIFEGALEQAVALMPEIIMLDINLPDGSGLDLLVKLKTDERTRHIPVLAISDDEWRTEIIQLGAVGFLLKPFAGEDVRLELINTAILAAPPAADLPVGPAAPLILIAEDNELILDTYANFLEISGYRVFRTNSSYELLECVTQLQPDIILMDNQMAGPSGEEVIKRLREHANPRVASTIILAITALVKVGDRERFLAAGANDYLTKPFALSQLDKKIRHFLHASRNPGHPQQPAQA